MYYPIFICLGIIHLNMSLCGCLKKLQINVTICNDQSGKQSSEHNRIQQTPSALGLAASKCAIKYFTALEEGWLADKFRFSSSCLFISCVLLVHFPWEFKTGKGLSRRSLFFATTSTSFTAATATLQLRPLQARSNTLDYSCMRHVESSKLSSDSDGSHSNSK